MAPTPSGPKQRAQKAIKAMEVMGFTRDVVSPLLKRLLRTFDYLWEHIEAENYRVLVDALLDEQSGELSPERKAVHSSPEPEIEPEQEPEPETRVTRQQVKREDEHASPPPPKPKRKVDATQELHQKTSTGERSGPTIPPPPATSKVAEVVSSPQPSSFIKKVTRASVRAEASSSQLTPVKRAAQDMEGPVPPQIAYRSEKRPISDALKEPKTEPGIEGMSDAPNWHGDEQFSDYYPLIEAPLATLPPVHLTTTPREDQSRTIPILQANASIPLQKQRVQKDNGKGPALACKRGGAGELSRPLPLKACAKQAPLATVSSGNLTTTPREDQSRKASPLAGDTSFRQSNASGPSREGHVQKDNGKGPVPACKREVAGELARVQEPASHIVDVAQSASGAVKLSFACSSDLPHFHMPSVRDTLKAVEDRCLRSYKIIQPDFSLMEVMKEMCECILKLGLEPAADKGENTRNPKSNGTIEKIGISNGQGGSSTSNSLVVVPQQQHLAHPNPPSHDVTDISRGEERVRIPLVNEHNKETLSRSFYYIPRNIVYQNAYVNTSLARIGDEDCCSDCFGDCLAEDVIPCACAQETGGDFAYTRDGLVKKKFLDTCISMNHNPEKDHLFFCKVCPIERSKSDDVLGPCKGHTIRKFIKECWSKCGCNKQCGNRVVQRGITCNLEVFYTEERKGWGVRSLDDLPRGTFVCEYVGEILTNTELYERTLETTGNARHTYPVLLDADWGSEGVLKDEDALCLDATFYGNVARFINHRCGDANLIEIPVEVEAPDRHYYHLAFFTTRKVEALEELTWDYGIDFDDHAHPIKAFRCRCGSQYCRDMKRKKSRSRKQQRN